MTAHLRLLLGFALAVAVASAAPDDPPLKDRLPRLKPTEPAEAAKTFRVLDGFRMELVAAEPQVGSPVAAAYDEDGRLYVVEMRDYPNPASPASRAIGRVRLLEDRDGDGVYETATVFADGLAVADGHRLLGRRGVRHRGARHLYFKDTKGDRHGRRAEEGVHRVRRVQRAGAGERAAVGRGQQDLRRHRRQRRRDPPRRQAQRRARFPSAVATSASTRGPASSRRSRAPPSSATRSTTGTTASSAPTASCAVTW